MNFRNTLSLVLVMGMGLCAASAQAVTCQAGIPASNPDSAYADNGNGTVTHTPTGLTWKRCQEGQTWSGGTCTGRATRATWSQALTQAASSSFAGQTDWRLPNVKELRSLVEECRGNPSINDTIFPNTSASYVWSGSPSADDASYAWYVSFSYGYSYNDYRYDDVGVRLVRGGQSLAPLTAPTCTVSATPSSITAGASATLTATCSPAATSYKWAGVTCANAGATCTVTPATTITYSMAGINAAGQGPSAQATVTVVGPATYGLHVSVSGSGTVRTSPGGMVCSRGGCVENVANGTAVTLTATPASGHAVNWSGACSAAVGNTCTVAMDANKDVGAVFGVLGPCDASPVESITPNAYAFGSGYQQLDVMCQNGRFGGVRLPRKPSDAMRICAFRETSCATDATQCSDAALVPQSDLDAVYSNRNSGTPTTTYSADKLVGSRAAWVCQ